MATMVHHKAGRIGKMLNDTEQWMALCFLCHRRVHDHGAWAREMGYLV